MRQLLLGLAEGWLRGGLIVATVGLALFVLVQLTPVAPRPRPCPCRQAAETPAEASDA